MTPIERGALKPPSLLVIKKEVALDFLMPVQTNKDTWHIWHPLFSN